MITLADNNQLTLEHFKRIFDSYSAMHLFNIWNRCYRMEGLFRLCLGTNEVLAWERAKYIHNDMKIVVTQTLFYN